MHKGLLSTLFAASLAFVPSIASAQQAVTPGFGVDRFNPSERGSEWFVLDSLDFRGKVRPAIGLVGEYAHKPLVIYNPDGSERTSVVSGQFFLHAGASLVLEDRLRIGFNLPMALANNGDNGIINGQRLSGPGRAALGDMRFSADLRILGEYATPFSLAIGGQVFMPTGERNAYTGDDQARGIVHAMAAGEIGMIVYGAKIGVHIRNLNTSFDGSQVGSEFIFGLSGGVRLLDRKLLVGPELYGATGVSNGDVVFSKQGTPLELLFGGHYTVAEDWRVGAGVGPGLTRGFGEPAVRVVFSAEWTPHYEKPIPPAPVGDRDRDGIADNRDACPDHPGPAHADARGHGCPPAAATPPPPPPDRDGDGIPDAEDACPDVKGVKTDDPKTNGCPPPPPDRDGDGIPDAEDACPDVKGVKTNDPKTNGCPPNPDRDGDGIPNEEDACPDAPGPKNADPKKNGCPAAAVVGNQIVIMEQVKFATGSAVILKESETILNAVLKVLNDHPEIKKVRIEGHTDNVGPAGYNKQLSTSRAASVMTWLVKHGIDKSRLSSQGFGMEKPIDDNKTEAGRKNNRRVEFHIESTP